MDRKRSLGLGAALIVSAAIAGCGGAGPGQTGPGPKIDVPVAKNVKATLGEVTGPSDDARDFADSAKSLSGGAIDITLQEWRAAEPGSEAGLVSDIAGGKAELGMVSARGFDTAGVNSFAGLQAPMLIDSYDLEARVLATDWATKLLDGPRSVGVVGIGYVQGELRQALGITRDLAQVSDFQGARIGIRASRVTEMTMKALGATTSIQPAAFDLTGLDGIEMGAPGIAGNDFYQGAKSITGNFVFWARPNVIIANAQWFDGLSAERQGQLRAAVAASNALAITRLRNNARESRDEFCANGFTIKAASAEALDGLRQRLQAVASEMAKDASTKATIDAITALRGATDAPDVLAPCPKAVPSPSPNSAPTAVDGVWKTSFTKAELIASPLLVDNGEINDQNWGDFIWTFSDGGFTLAQTNPIDASRNTGTFTVEGDVMRLNDDSGDRFAYRWSIFRDTLTIKRDPALPLGAPTWMLIKPWTRVP